jgi:hypothetical protein
MESSYAETYIFEGRQLRKADISMGIGDRLMYGGKGIVLEGILALVGVGKGTGLIEVWLVA